MRGTDCQTAAMFSYISPETLVPQDHPLRAIRPLVNAALGRLSGRFEQMYAPRGRDSIAPEKLLRALLLQALFSVRSERQLMEQITYERVKNLGHYAASWSAWWPKRPSSTAALT